MTGLTERLRELHPGVSIFLSCVDSGKSGKEDPTESFAQKAQESKEIAGLFLKPYDFKELDQQINEILERSEFGLSVYIPKDQKAEIDLLTVWPPSKLMSKWVYTLCGRKASVWYLMGHQKK